MPMVFEPAILRPNGASTSFQVQTRQLLQLFPQDFDAVVMPLLLKSRWDATPIFADRPSPKRSRFGVNWKV